MKRQVKQVQGEREEGEGVWDEGLAKAVVGATDVGTS